MGALKNHREAALQAIIKTIHEFPNKFILGFELDWRWSDRCRKDLLR